MKRIGLIQLSDLQFGPNHFFETPSTIVAALAADVTELAQKHQFAPTFLIVSGDVTETAHCAEFEEAERCLGALAERLDIDQETILVVPGNHDVNWKLEAVGDEIGNPKLKFNAFENFESHFSKNRGYVSSCYPFFIDNRLNLQFLLLNSCENEGLANHVGHIDTSKLLKSIEVISDRIRNHDENYLKVCVLHHRIDTTVSDIRSAIDNASEVESILLNNGFQIVMTGHVHQGICHEVKKDDKKIVYSGCGSSGVSGNQRPDGIQNQYCVHVLDLEANTIECFWRSFNPQKRTRFGLGGWTTDNSSELESCKFRLMEIVRHHSVQPDFFIDPKFTQYIGIHANPFRFNNAEKIQSKQVLDLFVTSDARQKGATRLSGDAIIRGRRGSGKTMLLRYLEGYAESLFEDAIRLRQTAEALPVFVNLSRLHPSDYKDGAKSAFEAADRLIYDETVDALEKVSATMQSKQFSADLSRLKTRLEVLENQEGTKISKMGIAIKEHMQSYFGHVLLLIDEVAPVFPREFFSDADSGFLFWMNSIRNSGPYFTRIAVYPNDLADVMNEDRFGVMVNLEYEVRQDSDYSAFREYCKNLIDKYLKSVSVDRRNPRTTKDILILDELSGRDALEQIIYAADGSSRRLLSLMDKCMHHMISRPVDKSKLPLTKDEVFGVIKEFSGNLFAGYNQNDKALALSLAKACKRQTTFRFKLPGLATAVNPLHAAKEESNIVKVAELGAGRRGSTYEFTYPFCVLEDIQTHFVRDIRKVCAGRDRIEGEWITVATLIKKEQLDIFENSGVIEGLVAQIDSGLALIKCGNKEYVSDDFPEDMRVGDKVAYFAKETVALDIQII